MNGITIVKNNQYCVVHVDNFSDDIKEAVRKNLRAICHGESDALSAKAVYSYGKTLKEFLRRYISKDENTQIGMMGELLTHVFIREELCEFSIDSPFFNMEEGSIKKGFDLVLEKNDTHELWIAEVKSGQIHKNKSASSTIKELIKVAKTDLQTRLSDCSDDAIHLWLNAIHGAKMVLDKYPERKEAIVAILEGFSDLSGNKSTDFNVILVGALFHDLSKDKLDENEVLLQRNAINEDKIFNDLFIIAMQKSTREAILEFFNSEITL